MIFSKNSRKAPHLLSLLVAFAVAVGMWYVVSVRDRLKSSWKWASITTASPPGWW